ncbi:hypothetical protein [Burkholderia gladioli]|uniref:hypothetical protein n=1 Tax=Burkholderia gladioli TaxID=28095 RepID=UPI0016412339|nr:hypothetical protein [Burkholderia gladioli]
MSQELVDIIVGQFVISIVWPVLIAAAAYGLVIGKKRRDILINAETRQKKNHK